jgi:uncharacterized protein
MLDPARAGPVLIPVFLLTSAVSVVTGGTSLITVPVMMQVGMDPHKAVATNMLALVFLSLGGALPFLREGALPRGRLAPLAALTLIGSASGAWLLAEAPAGAIPAVVAAAMIGVAAFTLANREAGLSPRPGRSGAAGYAATLALGVYGGFFSGGYVALLTAAFVAFFGMTFTEAVAVTKVLNFASSLVATLVFAARGLIDWRLGFLLGGVSFAGALAGASLARRVGDRWLRRVFLAVVLCLAAKSLLYDLG